ncbi:hypothetical protein EVAR_76739_1 [Eumeta japonica]|uniref:Uncharacterized protein n=1 Tax=Eumeta variegata TaxID=151549 RepID=A0A4C1STM9_EUMVA|nr:hypothetical protein EVAR_76739_1 [Eumeta japonica]
MAFAAARMILKDKRRKASKEDFRDPRNRSKHQVEDYSKESRHFFDVLISFKLMHAGCTQKSMSHCRVPPEPSVRARARNERSLFHSIDRCVREEERQRPHTTYT